VRPPTTTTAAVAVLLVALAGLAACGDDGGGEDSTASPTTATAPRATSAPDTTAPEPVSDEEAVLAAVQCYWDTIVEANDPPDPDHPGFERCMTGAALERSRGITEHHRSLGETVRDPNGRTEQFHSTVSQVDGKSAEVTQCIVDDAIVMRASDGLVLNDKVISASMRLVLVKDETAWRVENAYLTADREGRSLCSD
jgi:hypothetical protein